MYNEQMFENTVIKRRIPIRIAKESGISMSSASVLHDSIHTTSVILASKLFNLLLVNVLVSILIL